VLDAAAPEPELLAPFTAADVPLEAPAVWEPEVPDSPFLRIVPVVVVCRQPESTAATSIALAPSLA